MSRREIERSELESLVRDVRKQTAQIRRLESEINRISFFLRRFGIAFPGLAMLGPYGFAVAFVTHIATLIAQKITRDAMERAERERERERLQLRRELLREVRTALERERREGLRSVVPG